MTSIARTGALATLFTGLLLPALANATTYTVTSLADSGAGSLRATVAAAASGDIIQIAVMGTITLTSGEIAITKSLAIGGLGSPYLTISGNNASRIFRVSAGSASSPDLLLALTGMTLAEGNAAGTCPAPATASGGAIAATESLALSDVAIRNSQAARNGGGIAWAMRRNGQRLDMSNVRFIGNTSGCSNATAAAMGGGLFVGYDTSIAAQAAGVVTLSGSTFNGNTARRSGGGIAIAAPVTFAANGSRIVGNTAATAAGGGIYLAAPSASGLLAPRLILATSEVSDNVAATAGGGVAAANTASQLQGEFGNIGLSITNSTLSGNRVTAATADAAAINLAGNAVLALRNSTVAYNSLSAASAGSSVARNVCSGTVEPAASVISSIVAQTNGAASGFVDIADSSTFVQGWTVSNSLIRQPGVAISTGGNVLGADPQLIPLAWNGSTLRSHALASASPAINAGSNDLALTQDQRGAARTYGAATDIGAIESPFASPAACSFDFDGDGMLGAATDAILGARLLFGVAGDAVTTDAISASATRTNWTAINNYVEACGWRSLASACSFDLDGDGNAVATSDGLLLARLLSGLDGAIVADAANVAGSRSTWPALKAHLNANCGFALP